MATKNIKKILLNKDGDNFVADIENIENRISQNSSNLETAKQELSNKCDSNLASAKAYADTKKNEAIVSANAYTDQEKAKYLPLTGIAAHAKLADKATTATNADHATSAGSASSATKASQNGAGHSLADTIVKAIAINGRTITVTKIDGKSYTLTTQDTNTVYTHPATHPASMITGLATVAKTGKYSDLSERPSILSINSAYNATDGYCKLSDGTIFQYHKIPNGTTGSLTITWKIPFSSTDYVVIGNDFETSSCISTTYYQVNIPASGYKYNMWVFAYGK